MLVGQDDRGSAHFIDMVDRAIQLVEDLLEVKDTGAAEGVSAERQRTAALGVVAGVADEVSQELVQSLRPCA
ncbi:MAG: hypothetical protein J0651_02625 [Actinobacteria bacterium]|nr:hypothetical protein [Actinomycetota bacterium]